MSEREVAYQIVHAVRALSLLLKEGGMRPPVSIRVHAGDMGRLRAVMEHAIGDFRVAEPGNQPCTICDVLIEGASA